MPEFPEETKCWLWWRQKKKNHRLIEYAKEGLAGLSWRSRLERM
jgi:hypothetical protein